MDSWRATLLPWRSLGRIWTLTHSSTLDCGGFAGLFQPMPSAGSFSRRVSRGLLRRFHCLRSPFCLLSWSPPIWCRGSLAELVTEMTLLCPYQQDRLSRGLSVQCPQGPDWAETNLHRASSAAGGMQQRSDTFATGAPQALPPGLPPVVHAQCAAAFPHIAGGEPQLPDDSDWAFRLSTGQIEGVPLRSVRKWRTAKLRLLKRLVPRGEALGLAQYSESLRSSSPARIASHTHPARMALAMASLGWPDDDLPILMASGSSLLGEMPYSGIFRPVVSSPTLHWLSCWMVPRLTSTALRHARRLALTSRKSFGKRHPSPSPGLLWTPGGVAIFGVLWFASQWRSAAANSV